MQAKRRGPAGLARKLMAVKHGTCLGAVAWPVTQVADGGSSRVVALPKAWNRDASSSRQAGWRARQPARPAEQPVPMECESVSNLSDGSDALRRREALLRQLGATLAELGWDQALHRLGKPLPDARDRLSYVAHLTDDAAKKLVNLVDMAQPVCHAAAGDAQALAMRLAALAAHAELGVGEARAALAEAADTLRHQGGVLCGQSGVLNEILRVQDVQDLTGQAITKVVQTLELAELQLHQLLVQASSERDVSPAPADSGAASAPGKAEDPAPAGDLLASIGS